MRGLKEMFHKGTPHLAEGNGCSRPTELSKPLEQLQPHLQFLRISMALVVLPPCSFFGKGWAKDSQAFWRTASWCYLGRATPCSNMGAQQVLLFATKQQFWGFDLKHNISFPPLSALAIKNPSLSQPGLRSTSSLVKWEAYRADSRIPDFNFRLTFIGSFLPSFPLFPFRIDSSATHDENLFLLGLLETPWWVKLTCQSCLDVANEKSSHGCFWWEKARERDVFPPEHVRKGRRHGSLFPWDQIKLVPKCTCGDAQQTLSILKVPPWHKQCLTYRISLGPPGPRALGGVRRGSASWLH